MRHWNCDGRNWVSVKIDKYEAAKSRFPKVRRCHGSASPSLANLHPNSGPSKKPAARGKERVPVAQSAKEPEESNHEIATKSMPGADRAQLTSQICISFLSVIKSFPFLASPSASLGYSCFPCPLLPLTFALYFTAFSPFHLSSCSYEFISNCFFLSSY